MRTDVYLPLLPNTSLLGIKVQPHLGGYRISVGLFGRKHMSVEVRIGKPDASVAEVLAGIALGFKKLSDELAEQKPKIVAP